MEYRDFCGWTAGSGFSFIYAGRLPALILPKTSIQTMSSITSSLPAPTHISSDSKDDGHVSESEQHQLIKESHYIPPYGQRKGWKPKSQKDFGNGGAYPEVHVAQYPLNMGRKMQKSSTSNALTIQIDADGQVKYDAIAKQGHSSSRIVQTSFQDLIPLRQRANAGDISLERPSEEQVKSTTQKTQDAIAKILHGKLESSKPEMIAKRPSEPTYVRYTPSNMMGQAASNRQRIIKMVDVAQDPLAPPKFKHTKVPPRPPSPPAPILRSPPRKLTHKDQEDWYIPPSISNWKNPKGYTIPLDKRVATDGRGLQEVAINDNKAKLAEALYAADRSAREEIRQRAAMQQKLAEKEEAEKEARLRELARRARAEKTGIARELQEKSQERGRSRETLSRSPSRSSSRTPPRSSHLFRTASPVSDEEDAAAARRRQVREERKREAERELRRSRMGAERKIKTLAREQNRDISERVALGISKPTKPSGDDQFDSRLFSQVSTGGFSSSVNEDQVYDQSLFAAQEAIQSIYRPRGSTADRDDDGQSELDRFASENRFEGLGKTITTEIREGPVEFEKDTDDPFGVGKMMEEVKQSRKYCLDDSGRNPKRPRRDASA